VSAVQADERQRGAGAAERVAQVGHGQCELVRAEGAAEHGELQEQVDAQGGCDQAEAGSVQGWGAAAGDAEGVADITAD